MRKSKQLTLHLATMLILHACSAGVATTLLVTAPARTEWLPRDNQTVYKLEPGKIRSLELKTSGVISHPVFITVSPCAEVHWTVYHGRNGEGHLSFVEEHNGIEVATFSTLVAENDRYVFQLSAPRGGAAAISVRGERPKPSRLRLRVRSRRRLSAVWDPSPIDPHTTSYCVVASHRRNYTSLCSAQYDIKTLGKSSSEVKSSERHTNRYAAYRVRKADRFSEEKKGRDAFSSEIDISSLEEKSGSTSLEEDNKIDVDADSFGIHDGDFSSVYRRKKFSRSTKISEQDPVIACVGDRTHHFIDNLDISKTYFVSVFGVAQDKRAGTLLASGSVVPRSSTAKRLRENEPYTADIRGRVVFYYKATMSSGSGLWLAVDTCGGAVDVDVSVRGKKLYNLKNIDQHKNIFVPLPGSQESQESSDQYSSSSEVARVRYVVKVTPSQRHREAGVRIKLTASSTRELDTPVLSDAVVKELRPRRSCRSVDVAFLPATVNATDVIRYCISTRESLKDELSACDDIRTFFKSCVSYSQRTQAKVIIQRINNLSPARRYEVQVVAATARASAPYRTLYVETLRTCRQE